MKKGQVEFSWTPVIGIVIGILVIWGGFSIAMAFSKNILPSDDENKLKNSMEDLQQSINNLNINSNTEVSFYSVDKEIYLVASNGKESIPQCFKNSCIALCYDELCEKTVFEPKSILEGLSFETTGEIAVLDVSDIDYIFLEIENKNNNISITSSYQK